MKSTFRHTGVLFMIAVVALAVVGAGYALWFQVLTLDATVTTGTLDVEWSLEGTQEIYSTDLGDTWVGDDDDDDGFNPAKAVQECNAEITNSHLLDLSALGLYPYAGCEFTIDIHNNGTIPVHIDLDEFDFSDFSCEAVAPCDAETDINIDFNVLDCLLENTGDSADPTLDEQTNIVQLHPSNRILCQVRVTANQSAPEGAEYSGSIKLLACQWNEDVNCSFDNTQGRDNNETPIPPTATPTELPT